MKFMSRQARKQTELLAIAYTRMIKVRPFNKGNIALNLSALAHACVSCQIDMERSLPFHNIAIPSRYKQAAYIFKWVSRFRPISVAAAIGKETPAELSANAWFALLSALGELKLDFAAFSDSSQIKECLYCSLYRDIDAPVWALGFSLLEMAFPVHSDDI